MEIQVAKPPMILVIESDPVLLTGFAAILDMQGYRCFLARDSEVASQATNSIALDLIIFSINDSMEKTLSDAKALRAKPIKQGVPFIFIAAYPDVDWIGPLNSVGGVYCLPRNFEPQMLIDAVHKTLWISHLAIAKVAPPRAHFASQEWVRLN